MTHLLQRARQRIEPLAFDCLVRARLFMRALEFIVVFLELIDAVAQLLNLAVRRRDVLVLFLRFALEVRERRLKLLVQRIGVLFEFGHLHSKLLAFRVAFGEDLPRVKK
jgi:hypothetical protein